VELLRHSQNAWGQTALEGVSWDLLGVFFFGAVAFIVVHALYMWRFAPKKL
jgi:hypothetical protein